MTSKDFGLLLQKSLGDRVYRSIRLLYKIVIIKCFYTVLGLFADKEKRYEVDNLLFQFPESPLSFYGRKFQGYELSERTFVKKYLNPNSKVLELGGSAGIVSCVINKILINPYAHIVLEPNPNVLPFIKANKIENNCSFTVIQGIISATLKFCDFDVDENYLSSSNLKKTIKSQSIQIKCYSINDIQQQHSITFDTLVMDIEGNEFEFLMEFDLREINEIIMEVHPKILGSARMKEMYHRLDDLGFNKIDELGVVEFWKKE
ncbi:FkbM family methyltransferase [Bacteroidia bacterium]|nr:FkbM family methyltransferase [Bacteroidia bacterium]